MASKFSGTWQYQFIPRSCLALMLPSGTFYSCSDCLLAATRRSPTIPYNRNAGGLQILAFARIWDQSGIKGSDTPCKHATVIFIPPQSQSRIQEVLAAWRAGTNELLAFYLCFLVYLKFSLKLSDTVSDEVSFLVAQIMQQS